MTIDEMIQEAIEDGEGSVDRLSTAVLREIARRWIRDQVVGRERARVRRRERSAVRRSQTADTDQIVDLGLQQTLLAVAQHLGESLWEEELLNSMYDIPEMGMRVTLRSMTVEHHQSRLRTLRNQAVALVQDIAIHERAVADIQRLGVRNLDEVIRLAAA